MPVYWEELVGVELPAGLCVGKNLDGRLEVFGRNGSEIVHNWQTEPGPVTKWSGWNSLGGQSVGEPIVRRASDGRLFVFSIGFARGRGRPLQYIAQVEAGGAWSAWTNLIEDVSHFDVCSDSNGSLVAFAVAAAGGSRIASLVYRRQAAGDVWSPALEAAPLAEWVNPFVAYCNADGRLEVFDATGNGFHSWEDAPGLWGVAQGDLGDRARDIVVTASENGRLYIFGRGSRDEALNKDIHIFQTRPSNGWAQNSAGPMWTTSLIETDTKPVVVKNVGGEFQIFLSNAGGEVQLLSQISAESQNWERATNNLGGAGLTPRAAELNKFGQIEVFATDMVGRVFHAWQQHAGGAWNST